MDPRGIRRKVDDLGRVVIPSQIRKALGIAEGYEVESVPVPVPAGNSWGIDVPAGDSANVIADPPDLDPTEPHVVIGAHLDTVPQAPGAEDNASGVAVMVELARMAAEEPPAVPVRFIAFGAEEPRGEEEATHDGRPKDRGLPSDHRGEREERAQGQCRGKSPGQPREPEEEEGRARDQRDVHHEHGDRGREKRLVAKRRLQQPGCRQQCDVDGDEQDARGNSHASILAAIRRL